MQKTIEHRIKVRRYPQTTNTSHYPKAKLFFQRCITTLCLSISIDSMASTVGHSISFPAATMNENGDFIAAGNWRVMLSWNSVITRAPKDSLSNHPDSVFSVGIASNSSVLEMDEALGPVAIACDSKKAIVYFPSHQKENINGRWKELSEIISSKAENERQLRCSMSANASWAVLDLSQSLLYTKQKTIHLPDLGQMATLTANRNHFFIASQSRGLITLTHEGTIVNTQPLPFSYWDDSLRMAASDKGLIIADSAYANYTSLNTQPFALTEQSVNLPIHAGDEDYESVPSVSIASDGSWIIGGFWGLWSGKENDLSVIKRLHSRIEAPRSAGFAFAHSGYEKTFLGIGSNDGDMGPIALLRQTYGSSAKDSMLITGFVSRNQKDDDPDAKIWWQDAIGLSQAHQRILENTGDTPIRSQALVAVIDSGSELEHPMIEPFLSENPGESFDQLDNDLNGLTDDISGYDFVQDLSRPQDKHGHGSHVSGIILAQVNTDKNPKDLGIKLLSLRSIDQSGKSNSIDLARAINNAVAQGADIINCSWGGGRPTVALELAFKNALKRGALIITSSGNDASNNDRYPVFPAAFDGVISVGSTNQKGRLSDFSNWGKESVDLLAPGENIWSTYLDKGWAFMSGTSMAAPMVSHLAGLIVSVLKNKRPDLNIFERRKIVKDILCDSAQTLRPKAKSRCGLIHAEKATDALISFLN